MENKLVNEIITITKEEYGKLLDAYYKLNALENAGVDNWKWYGEAIKSLDEDEENDDMDDEEYVGKKPVEEDQ